MNIKDTIQHSFVIPAYKESVYLQDCIDSLKNQSIKSNIIITTSTPCNFIQKIANNNKIPLIINTQKSGIATDWNFALNLCKTDFCTLAHQDDIYYPHYTEFLLTKMLRNENSLIGFTNYSDINKNQEEFYWRKYLIVKRLLLWPYFVRSNWKSKLVKWLTLAFGSSICCPSVMYNLKILDKFKFSKEYSINLDWDVWSRIANIKGSFIYIRKKCMAHRIHSGSETSKGLKEGRRQDEDLKMFRRFWPKPIALLLARIYALSYKDN